MKLPVKHLNPASGALTTDHLTQETKFLIEEVYEKDFEKFRYQKTSGLWPRAPFPSRKNMSKPVAKANRTIIPIDHCSPLPNDRLKRLELLHIPKTGGSALEILAAVHNISWGGCHWLPAIANHSCPLHPERPLHWKKEKISVSFWHLPLNLFDDNSFCPYDDAAVFTVVRNPFERLVSQWNYKDINVTGLLGYDRNNPGHMNKFFRKILTKLRLSNESMADYYQWDGHYIPQYDYIQGRNVTILRQERLSEDFACLMKRYHMEHLQLPAQLINPADGELTAGNLSLEVKALVEDVYHKDFEYFGYRKKFSKR